MNLVQDAIYEDLFLPNWKWLSGMVFRDLLPTIEQL